MSKRLYLALVLILVTMLSGQVLPYEELIDQFIASRKPKRTLSQQSQRPPRGGNGRFRLRDAYFLPGLADSLLHCIIGRPAGAWRCLAL